MQQGTRCAPPRQRPQRPPPNVRLLLAVDAWARRTWGAGLAELRLVLRDGSKVRFKVPPGWADQQRKRA